MKSFGLNFFSNFMHGLKSAILKFYQKSADWLDWPCPVSAALQNCAQDFFSLLSEVVPGVLVIQIQIQAV
jgi:hypothetical protein